MENLTKKLKPSAVVRSIAASFIVYAAVSFCFAWFSWYALAQVFQDPLEGPPNATSTAAVNTGSTGQKREGNLTLGGGITVGNWQFPIIINTSTMIAAKNSSAPKDSRDTRGADPFLLSRDMNNEMFLYLGAGGVLSVRDVTIGPVAGSAEQARVDTTGKLIAEKGFCVGSSPSCISNWSDIRQNGWIVSGSDMHMAASGNAGIGGDNPLYARLTVFNGNMKSIEVSNKGVIRWGGGVTKSGIGQTDNGLYFIKASCDDTNCTPLYPLIISNVGTGVVAPWGVNVRGGEVQMKYKKPFTLMRFTKDLLDQRLQQGVDQWGNSIPVWRDVVMDITGDCLSGYGGCQYSPANVFCFSGGLSVLEADINEYGTRNIIAAHGCRKGKYDNDDSQDVWECGGGFATDSFKKPIGFIEIDVVCVDNDLVDPRRFDSTLLGP
ncbi:MAG: hypothetical protein A3J67_02530 [Parcubacteria group bacterium RIFCSPHIGHO2_02_FULL_48_10b]|nr:MAG: hypothetical protein A3J67_02530 [Parcubacteria group bacterium RIFCSPHIGHO2_02_FULL_48_10b]